MREAAQGGSVSDAEDSADFAIRELRALRDADRDLHQKLRAADQELANSRRAGDLENVRTALAAAQELGKVHNGLLRRMEVLTESFATKEAVQRQFEVLTARFARIDSWMAKLTGAGTLLALVGVAQLARWFS